MDSSPETMKLLERGKLEQVCPSCGTCEAAHFYCSKCHVETGPADWHRNGDMAARTAARQRLPENRGTPLKRGRGRPRRVSAHEAEGS